MLDAYLQIAIGFQCHVQEDLWNPIRAKRRSFLANVRFTDQVLHSRGDQSRRKDGRLLCRAVPEDVPGK